MNFAGGVVFRRRRFVFAEGVEFSAEGATTKSSDHEVVRFEIAIARDRRIIRR